jgi:hypothetical protein
MKRIVLLLLFCLGAGWYNLNAQNEKFKALFMYNFTKYIEWPPSMRSGDFIIGVLGNSPLTPELNNVSKTQRVGNQKITVVTFNSVDQISQCHILYIPASKSSMLPQVNAITAGKNILIVTDKSGLASQGAGLNYILDGERLKYEVNKSSIEKRGLAVNSTLISLGVEVK